MGCRFIWRPKSKFASFLFTLMIVSSFNNNTTQNFNTKKNDLTQTSQQTHDTLSNVISFTEFATKMLMCSLGASNNNKKLYFIMPIKLYYTRVLLFALLLLFGYNVMFTFLRNIPDPYTFFCLLRYYIT